MTIKPDERGIVRCTLAEWINQGRDAVANVKTVILTDASISAACIEWAKGNTLRQSATQRLADAVGEALIGWAKEVQE